MASQLSCWSCYVCRRYNGMLHLLVSSDIQSNLYEICSYTPLISMDKVNEYKLWNVQLVTCQPAVNLLNLSTCVSHLPIYFHSSKGTDCLWNELFLKLYFASTGGNVRVEFLIKIYVYLKENDCRVCRSNILSFDSNMLCLFYENCCLWNIQ